MPPGIRWTAACFGAIALVSGCSPAQSPQGATTSATSSTTPPASADAAPSVATPLVAAVIAAPIPVPATDGKVHLAYELQLTNVLADEVTLTSVAVRAGDRTLLDLAGDPLAYWTRLLGMPTPTTKIGPAQSAMVWLDVALDKGAPVPNELIHAVGISLAHPMPPLFPATMTETVAPVTVQTREPVVISPPLSGPNWMDGDGCCDMGSHRTALNPINGRLWGAERFAIDYVQLRPDGRLFIGDPAKPETFTYYGADIMAVSDGPVVAAVDGLPEQVPGRNPTGLPLDSYAGNHVVQDLGNGNYALYAHIKTDTVRVKPGDRLSRGQVIGSVGNTGNSTAPHLHFHVMSTPDPLRSNGLPFVFTGFRLDSRVSGPKDELDDIFNGQPVPMQPGFAGRDESNVMPLDLDVMTYAGR
jgi:hypothetical protein